VNLDVNRVYAIFDRDSKFDAGVITFLKATGLKPKHEDRIHDALAKDTPNRRPVEQKAAANTTVVSSTRLGGLHHRYSWSRAA
jgi:hypothetical protein